MIVINVSYVDDVISTEFTGTAIVVAVAASAIVGTGHPRWYRMNLHEGTPRPMWIVSVQVLSMSKMLHGHVHTIYPQ